MKRLFWILLFGFLILSPVATQAEMFCPLDKNFKPKTVASLETFKRTAILENGRIKPLETYGQNLLLQFSGKRTFSRKPAIHWLAKLVFAPASCQDDKIFLINNPELPMALGIEPEAKRRYSYAQLTPGFDKLNELARKARAIDKKSRTIVEDEILRVFENLDIYSDLSGVLLFALPHLDFSIENTDMLEELQSPKEKTEFSFFEIASKANILEHMTRGLDKKDPKEWTSVEKEAARLISNLYQWSSYYKGSHFQILPSVDPVQELWLSPWDAIAASFSSETTQKEIKLLSDMTAAYWQGNQLEFDLSANALNNSVQGRVNPAFQRSLSVIPLELIYNHIKPFAWAESFYALAFIFFLSSLLSIRPIWHRLGFYSVLLGFAPHAFGLLTRIIILARPPVTNLYETFIFVAFISVLLGITIEFFNKEWLGIVVASSCGLIFLLIADKFAAEGDTLKMLVAVLNSNFWLGTHVLSITTGYAGVCVAGIIGHVYILQALFKPGNKEALERTYKNILGILGFGLTMAFLGTTLGGIWADQSWGRFWGWDPKENGALLIVIWTSILFHAKVGEMIGPIGIAVGSILGIIVVMWAWFGVNLLSVGLHSYGFTSGVASSLLIYVVLQILFLILTVPLIKRRGKL